MNRKPGVILFLAWFQIAGILGDVFFGAWLSHISVFQYLSTVHQMIGPSFWLGRVGIALLSAFAIWSVKAWSLPVCIAVSSYNIAQSSSAFSGYDHPFAKPLIVASYLLNLSIITYFLLPAVREIYLNRRLRWWENSPRFFTSIPCKLTHEEKTHACIVNNVSEGGAFLEGIQLTATGGEVAIVFAYESLRFNLRGIIRHAATDEASTLGIQFIDVGPDSRQKLLRLTRALDLLDVKRRPERSQPVKEFSIWLVRAFTTGEGWILRKNKASSTTIAVASVSESTNSTENEKSKAA